MKQYNKLRKQKKTKNNQKKKKKKNKKKNMYLDLVETNNIIKQLNKKKKYIYIYIYIYYANYGNKKKLLRHASQLVFLQIYMIFHNTVYTGVIKKTNV